MKLNKLFVIAALAAVVLSAGCTTEKAKMEEHNFDNRLFITASSSTEEILVKPSLAGAIVKQLTVGTALKADTRITGLFAASPELLETYKLSFYD